MRYSQACPVRLSGNDSHDYRAEKRRNGQIGKNHKRMFGKFSKQLMEKLFIAAVLSGALLPATAAVTDSTSVNPPAAAADTDTGQSRKKFHLVNKSWFLVPIGFYQEETSVGLGVTGGYYFNSHNLRKISSISGSVTYTFLNQAKINLNPRIYSKNEKFYFSGNLNLRYYPDKYFGRGNVATGLEYDYTTESFVINIQPFYAVTPDISIGPYLDFTGEKILPGEKLAADLPLLQAQYGEAGWTSHFMWGIGLQFMYDTRDNTFYPQKFSNFLKISALSYTKALGSTYDATMLTLDFRQYIPTWLGQVLAWQVYINTALGGNVPFRMLPYVGGSDNLRGFRERLYSDNFMFEAQAEYRIPIYKRLKAAVFCSVGDVVNIYDAHINKLKVGYGAGLRFRLNDARVHLRVDFAGNNYGEFKFYITATEAF